MTTAVTVTTLYQRLQTDFGDVGGIYLKDHMILAWVNRGIRTILRNTEYGRSSTQTITLAADTATWLPAGSNIYKVHFIYLRENKHQIQETTYQDLLEQRLTRDFSPDTKGIPMYYWRENLGGKTSLRFWPVPDKEYSADISFTAIPDDLPDVDAIITDFFPVAWIDDLLLYCTIKAHEREKDWQAARERQEDFDATMTRRYDEAHGIDDDFNTIGADEYDNPAFQDFVTPYN